MSQPRRLLVAALALAVASAAAVSARAQTRRAMTLVDVANYPKALDPQISPDGQAVSYMLQAPDWTTSGYVPQIWKQPTAGGPPVQLTTAGGALARWSPDSRTIAFNRGGQIWLVPAAGGEARQLTKHVTSVVGNSPAVAHAWTPDGAALYFVAPDPPTAEEREKARIRDDVAQPDDQWKQRHLWKVTVADGAETQITSGDLNVLSFRLSRDGTRIAMERTPSPRPIDTYLGEVWVMDADGGHARALTKNANFEDTPELSPDNSQVLFMADMNDAFESYYLTTLFVVPAAGGTPKRILPEGTSFDRASWGLDNRTILAVINMGVHNEVVSIDVQTGATKQLTSGDHSIPGTPGPAWGGVEPKSGTVTFLMEDATQFGEIFTLPASGGGPAKQVSSVFDAMKRDFLLPRQERVEWTSADGTTIEGLLFYPLDYQPGTRYPLVVQLHGGPNEADRFGMGTGFLFNYVPVLAARGYAVLRPNYRGSIGYGNAFYRDIVGGYFRNMHLDVMTGVDHVVAMGVADPGKLMVTGFSAGATLVNKLITFTDRFKAASSTAGVANWVSLYGQSDIRSNRTVYFGGTPWQKGAPIDVYWSHSPIRDVADVRTPTIFFAGANDERIPVAQSQEMSRALRMNGVPTKLNVAPREGHGWGEVRHNFYKANAELEWFERYALGRTYVWEQAPGDSNPDKPKPSQP